MFETTRVVRIAAGLRHWLFSLTVLVMLAAGSTTGSAQSGFDIGSVPRPDGAEMAEDRGSSSSVVYVYPASVPNTLLATEQALNANGWMRYLPPDENRSGTNLRFKKDRLGIYVSFTMSGGKSDRSRISYTHNNAITANVPFPADATDIVYDEFRPYLRCVTGGDIAATLDFFVKGLAAEGWSQLAASSIEARWPHARIAAVENGTRVYFIRDGRDRQPPVMLTLQRATDGKTSVDLRIAPFALPQELAFSKEMAGLPAPERTKTVSGLGSPDSVRRESRALVIAEIPAVLAFYRREMAARGWTEQAAGTIVSDSAAKLSFASSDGTATLELGQRHDFTTVLLVAQLSDAAIAARAKAKKDADEKFMRDARQQADVLIAASETKRRAAAEVAAAAPVEKLKPLASATVPFPLPENANGVAFNGEDGKLDFTSASSVRSVAAFYRDALKAGGWQEQKSVINNPTMVRMDFTKGKQKVGFTVMQFGANAKVSAQGSGLQVAAAPADPNRETQVLEVQEASGFPVPKNYTLSAPGAWNMKGSTVAFRRDFNAQVPADIGSVLAFYRRELTKREWKELSDGAVVKPENVLLAFNAPDGPASLKLGRQGRETTISLSVKNPAEAAKAGVLPAAGKAKIILGNFGDAEASVTIDQKTVKVVPDAGSSKTPNGPTLELRPGKYKYTLKLAGKPNQNGEIAIAADDTWGLLIGPGGILPLQLY